MADYDQRWVRRAGKTFISASGMVSLCEGCGRCETCEFRGSVKRGQGCMIFLPVISFVDDLGLDRSFNTFRRGPGIYKRVTDGLIVALYSTARAALVGSAVVVGRHVGTLGDLLAAHARHNHLMLSVDAEEAPERLAKVLVKLYGKNYGATHNEFSVIVMERVDEG